MDIVLIGKSPFSTTTIANVSKIEYVVTSGVSYYAVTKNGSTTNYPVANYRLIIK